MKNINSNLTWSKQIVNLLYQKGVRYACISPGSRNTPLVYQFINHLKIKCYSHIDERSCSFFGLGIAQKTKTPVVILTTSGTATANLFPAVIESSMSMMPLIIITADRPKYLLNTGENQTINQKNIYGSYTRSSLDINHKRPLSALKKIDKTFNTKGPNGPIHLNIRIDEPLIDKESKIVSYAPKKYKYKRKKIGITLPLFKKPLIICGGLSSNESNQILALAEKIDSPIFADILSNMRHLKSNRIKVYYDHYIKNLKIKPDFILRFGRKPISKNLCKFLNKNAKRTFLLEPYGNFNDNCKNTIKSSLDDIILKFSSKNSTDKNWIEYIGNIESSSKIIIEKNITNNSEPSLIKSLKTSFSNQDCLFIGNSTPIRTFDQFYGKFNTEVNVFANRGASGIDGLTSTALGISEANQHSRNFLIIGDISFFHDSNAFHIINSFTSNLTIIVINNNGGRIFSKLDYSQNNIKGFNKYWITPPITRVKDLASLYKLKYYKLKNDEVQRKIKRISLIKGIKIIEVLVDASKDVTIKKQINKEIEKL